MAIYHFSVKVVSRAKGQSAVAKAAYNNRMRMRDERTGESYDYRRKGAILFSGIFAPQDAPEWVQDRATLYNEIERTENRKDAQLLREVEIALPHELTELQRERLVKDFVREEFVRQGMLADVAIHAPDPDGDERNHHAHILLTMREFGPDGFGAKVREWNSKEQLEDWRDAWERTTNRYLERYGHEARIDRRTLEAQGVDREPTVHRGPNVDAMERDGLWTELGAQWREIQESNADRAELSHQLGSVESEICLTGLEELGGLNEKNVEHRDVPAIGLDLGDAVHGADRLVGAVVDVAADAVEKMADGIATAFESLFVGSTPAPKPKPRVPQSEHKPDLRRYLADEDYRRMLAQREIDERQQQERDYYKKQNERER